MSVDRRSFLCTAVGAALPWDLGAFAADLPRSQPPPRPKPATKKLAVVTTAYHYLSHAYHIAGEQLDPPDGVEQRLPAHDQAIWVGGWNQLPVVGELAFDQAGGERHRTRGEGGVVRAQAQGDVGSGGAQQPHELVERP